MADDEPSRSFASFTDEGFRRSLRRAIGLVGAAIALGVALSWWRWNWRTAVSFLLGGLISGSGLFEWLRLMTALMAGMAAAPDAPVVRPLVPVLLGFFLRLGIALLVLYGNLNYLHGSVTALACGLLLGVAALLIEAVRLIASWTM